MTPPDLIARCQVNGKPCGNWRRFNAPKLVSAPGIVSDDSGGLYRMMKWLGL